MDSGNGQLRWPDCDVFFGGCAGRGRRARRAPGALIIRGSTLAVPYKFPL